MYPTEPRNRTTAHLRARGGFTLVELMAASGLSAIILLGILSSFVLIGKNGYNAANYSMMEAESRRALEMFTEEARMASNLTWNNSYSVTLTVVAAVGTTTVTYTYDNGTTGTTAKCFYRKTGTATSTAAPLVLVHNVTDFAFRRYKIVNGSDFTASNDLETKQLQIALRTVRTGSTTVNATNAVLSARVVLRNKRVST